MKTDQTADRIYVFSPKVPPVWRLTLDHPHKLSDMFLVAFGIDPRQTGVPFGSTDRIVTAVLYDESDFTTHVDPTTLRNCPPEQAKKDEYTLLRELAPEYEQLLSAAEQQFRRARTDTITGRRVIEWLYDQGVNIPNFLRLEVERYRPKLPKRRRKSSNTVAASAKRAAYYDDAGSYMTTNELAGFVHTLFTKTKGLPRVDFDYLVDITEEQWRRRFSKTGTATLDCTGRPGFRKDTRASVTVVIPGRKGRGTVQNRRHIYWTLIAILLNDHATRNNKILRAQLVKSLLSVITSLRYQSNQISADERFLRKILFRNYWNDWLASLADRYIKNLPKSKK